MDTTTGTILSPDGSLATIKTVILDREDAELLRRYKKFLSRHGLREALFCNSCWDTHSLADGCEAHVTNHDILIRCRCTQRFYRGMSV